MRDNFRKKATTKQQNKTTTLQQECLGGHRPRTASDCKSTQFTPKKNSATCGHLVHEVLLVGVVVEVPGEDVVAQGRVVQRAIRPRVVLEADGLGDLPRHDGAQLGFPQHDDPLALLDGALALLVVLAERGSQPARLWRQRVGPDAGIRNPSRWVERQGGRRGGGDAADVLSFHLFFLWEGRQAGVYPEQTGQALALKYEASRRVPSLVRSLPWGSPRSAGT